MKGGRGEERDGGKGSLKTCEIELALDSAYTTCLPDLAGFSDPWKTSHSP